VGRAVRLRGVAALGVVASVACGGSASEPILAGDKLVAVTADDLLDVAAIDRTKETWDKSKSFDGAIELSYTYEADAFYLTTTANHEVDADSAGYVYAGANIGLDIVAGAYGEEAVFVDDPLVFSWGDERDCRQLQMQGMSVGTMCVARKGRLVYTFMVAGQAFTEPGSLDVFLADELVAFEAWAP
jgi:hypothetical protein